MTYLIRGLGFQKRMRNYLYKGYSARIYMLFKFYRTAIIWNHFRVGKQDEISQFLKQVFAITFKDVEVGSIKSHLRDDEKKGTIPIVQSLSDHQITE